MASPKNVPLIKTGMINFEPTTTDISFYYTSYLCPGHYHHQGQQHKRTHRQLLFRALCFLCGQYFPPVITNPRLQSQSRRKSRRVIAYFFIVTVTVGFLNFVPTLTFPIEWAYRAGYQGQYNYGICYTLDSGGTSESDTAYGANKSRFTNSRSCLSLHQYIFFFKVVMSFCSFSSSISYMLILYPLVRQYIAPHYTNIRPRITCDCMSVDPSPSDEECCNPPPLTPFSDDMPSTENFIEEHEETSTPLSIRESIFFNVILVLSIAAQGGCIITLWSVQSGNSIKPLSPSCQETYIWNFLLFTYSLFCTTVSCFLFSKVAYGVSKRCHDMLKWVEHVNISNDDIKILINRLRQQANVVTVLETLQQENQIAAVLQYLDKHYLCTQLLGHQQHRSILDLSPNEIKLYYIQARDDHFLKQAKATIRKFELWYSVHWICYTISSFLTIALFIQSLVEQVKHSAPVDEPRGVGFEPPEYLFLGLFTLNNCLLFLYPCFRAAAITSARQEMIRNFNRFCCLHIAPSVKQRMIEYLKNQGFGFRIQLLCAKLTFEFNIAYLSIFIALLGILSSLSDHL